MPEPPSREELRVLAHYAKGEALSVIAAIVGEDVAQVRDSLGILCGHDRGKAARLVRREERQRGGTAVRVPAHLREAPVPPAEPVAVQVAPGVYEQEIPAVAEVGPLVVEPAPVRPRAGEVLQSYSSWLCEGCSSRFLAARECCRRPATPVTVTVSRREVPSG